ncbi:MAG: hypothetical protein J6Q64_03995, partial [Clostridia bacterium]|nr:hypothetical protein [Clostridia bacterium]
MKRIIRSAVLVLALLMLLGSVSVFATTPYKTYTYAIDGSAQDSPDAYVPDRLITTTDMGLDNLGLNNPSDMVVGPDGCIYIADNKNDRVVVLNKNYKLKFYIKEFVNYYGVHDSLSKPRGVFATDSYIYVADTENSRIVMFDLEGNFVRTLDRPSSDIFEANDL